MQQIKDNTLEYKIIIIIVSHKKPQIFEDC